MSRVQPTSGGWLPAFSEATQSVLALLREIIPVTRAGVILMTGERIGDPPIREVLDLDDGKTAVSCSGRVVSAPMVRDDGSMLGLIWGKASRPVTLTGPQRHRLMDAATLLGRIWEWQVQAHYDPLTGVGNRRELEAWLRLPTASQTPKIAIYCDLDNLKPLNESAGHAVGDRALKIVADSLVKLAAPRGVVCRMGGDEFVVALTGVPARTVRARLQACLADWQRPDRLGIPGLRLSATAGIATSVDPSVAWSTLLETADHRLLTAKRGGKGALVG